MYNYFGKQYCSKCNFEILEGEDICHSCGDNLKIQSKSKPPKYESCFWKDIKEVLSNILSGKISDNAKSVLSISFCIFLLFLFWISLVIPPNIGKYFLPLKNFILYFWNYYILLWEYFGIDTTSNDLQIAITYGIVALLGIIIEFIKIIDLKNNKYLKLLSYLSLIITIILVSFARVNNLGENNINILIIISIFFCIILLKVFFGKV